MCASQKDVFCRCRSAWPWNLSAILQEIRFHLERATFHLKRDGIILLRTETFRLYIVCGSPCPPSVNLKRAPEPLGQQCFCPVSPDASVLVSSPVSVSALSGVIDPSHQLVLGWPDLIYPLRGACLWADGPLWRWSSSSSSYKLALDSLLGPPSLCVFLFFFFLKLSSLKPCHQHLSYLPGGSANSIRGTCLTNALPLSVSVSFTALAICGVACLAPHFLLCDRYPHSVALRCPAGCPCRRWSLARL